MYWQSCNNVLHLLNKAKSLLFQSIMNFKKFENHVDFVCRSASQPAITPSCVRCCAIKITQNNRLLCWIYEAVVPKAIFQLRHSDCFYPSLYTIPYDTGLKAPFVCSLHSLYFRKSTSCCFPRNSLAMP